MSKTLTEKDQVCSVAKTAQQEVFDKPEAWMRRSYSAWRDHDNDVVYEFESPWGGEVATSSDGDLVVVDPNCWCFIGGLAMAASIASVGVMEGMAWDPSDDILIEYENSDHERKALLKVTQLARQAITELYPEDAHLVEQKLASNRHILPDSHPSNRGTPEHFLVEWNDEYATYDKLMRVLAYVEVLEACDEEAS